MSGLLRLTNEFIERMMNPSYGPLVNEEYGMRLGELLADEGMPDQLAHEASRLTRVDELSAPTWLWLVRQPEAAALDRGLLLHLCLGFEAAAFRATVIDRVLRDSPKVEPGEVYVTDRLSVQEIRDPWLRDLIMAVVEPEGGPELTQDASLDPDGPVRARDAHSAQSMLVALLSVGRRDCHEAASALLHHEWVGQEALLESFDSRTASMDEDSRSQWTRLRPHWGRQG